MKYKGKVYANVAGIHIPLQYDTGNEVESDDIDQLITIAEKCKKHFDALNNTVGLSFDQIILTQDIDLILKKTKK